MLLDKPEFKVISQFVYFDKKSHKIFRNIETTSYFESEPEARFEYKNRITDMAWTARKLTPSRNCRCTMSVTMTKTSGGPFMKLSTNSFDIVCHPFEEPKFL